MTNQVPDYCEPLIGYRAWMVDEDGLLRSWVIGHDAWVPYRAQESFHAYTSYGHADRFDGDHGACLRTGCEECGIYATTRKEALTESLYRDVPCVVGTVALWGTVVVHEFGYRAEFAYPQTLLGAIDCDGAAVAKTYGIAYEEDLTWKSERQSKPWWSSLYGSPFPSASPPLWGTPILAWLRTHSANAPWSSRILCQPDAHKFIVEPPAPAISWEGVPAGMRIPEIVPPKYYRTPAGVWAPHGAAVQEDDEQETFWFLPTNTIYPTYGMYFSGWEV